MIVSKRKQLTKMKEEIVFTILKYRDALSRLPKGTVETDEVSRSFVWEYEVGDQLRKEELDYEKDWRQISELMFKRSLEEDEDMCIVNLCAIEEYLEGEAERLLLLVKRSEEPELVDLTDSELWDEFLPMFRTNGGDYVCTISEAIIAEGLYKLDIEYKYKEALTLDDGRIIYPTFTLYDNKIGKKKFLDHQEMLEDERKANMLCSTLNAYSENNLWYGRDVILSWETANTPLDIEYVMEDVDRIFFGNMPTD